MLELILDDLARLDQLERDHAIDSVSLADFKKAISQQILALDACDQALIAEKRSRQLEAGKLQEEQADHDQTRKQLKTQKFLKWIGFGVALLAIIAR